MKIFRVETPPRRAAVTALGAAVVGWAGALPAVGGASDPHALLAWLALCAPAAGVLSGSRGLALWPFGLAVPGFWMLALVLAELGAERDLATPLWAALAFTGLFVGGMALGRLCTPAGWGAAGAALLLTGLLVGLPGRAGLTPGRTWAQPSPALAATLFDLSPLTLTMEAAGVDWAHKPAAYDSAGTDWFSGPGGRKPYRGELAGPVVLLVGWASYLVVLAAQRRTRTQD